MMSPLLHRIVGKNSGDKWELIGTWDPVRKTFAKGPWIYEFSYKGKDYKLSIRYSFKADGASVPWLVTPIARMKGRAMPDEAWLPHDYFYSRVERLDRYGYVSHLKDGELLVRRGDIWENKKIVDRDFVDSVFVQELKKPEHNFSRWKSWKAARAVKNLGWAAWRT